jgi:hypothetical protein
VASVTGEVLSYGRKARPSIHELLGSEIREVRNKIRMLNANFEEVLRDLNKISNT